MPVKMAKFRSSFPATVWLLCAASFEAEVVPSTKYAAYFASSDLSLSDLNLSLGNPLVCTDIFEVFGINRIRNSGKNWY